jgi:hypothetical protein
VARRTWRPATGRAWDGCHGGGRRGSAGWTRRRCAHLLVRLLLRCRCIDLSPALADMARMLMGGGMFQTQLPGHLARVAAGRRPAAVLPAVGQSDGMEFPEVVRAVSGAAGVIGRGPAARRVRSLRADRLPLNLPLAASSTATPPPGSPSSWHLAPTVALRLLGQVAVVTPSDGSDRGSC